MEGASPADRRWGLVTVPTGDGRTRAGLRDVDGGPVWLPDALAGCATALDVIVHWDRLTPWLRTISPEQVAEQAARQGAGKRYEPAAEQEAGPIAGSAAGRDAGGGPYVGGAAAGSVLTPLIYPRKVLCSGPNYRDHLAEMGESGLGEGWRGYFFFKPPSTTLIGPEDAILVGPDWMTDRVDWEGELAVVIGRGGRDIPPGDALSHVAGYTVANDVSLRGPHRRNTPAAPFVWDWTASKAADTSLPLGPAVVPAWQVPDPQDLRVRTRVNGEPRQDGHTADMVLEVAELVADASALVTLEPGDVILTGTPAGVGAARGTFLRPGDVVEVEIPGIGRLRNPIRERKEH